MVGQLKKNHHFAVSSISREKAAEEEQTQSLSE